MPKILSYILWLNNLFLSGGVRLAGPMSVSENISRSLYQGQMSQ